MAKKTGKKPVETPKKPVLIPKMDEESNEVIKIPVAKITRTPTITTVEVPIIQPHKQSDQSNQSGQRGK